MKIITMMLHGLSKDDSLTDEGLAKIEQTFGQKNIGGQLIDVTDVFYNSFFRSVQTALAIVATVGIRANIHPIIAKLGNDSLINEVLSSAVIELLEKDTPLLMALYQIHGKTKTKKFANEAKNAIYDILTQMRGNHALAIGEMPLIPLAAMTMGGEYRNLKNLESIKFGLWDNGLIQVVRE